MLVLVILAFAFSAPAEPAVAVAADEAVPLPAVGDTVEGFEAKEIRRFDMIAADLVLFEHLKTGAKLVYIANADTNRAFQLTFPTRPVDNTGLPHVFEHSTLSGSEKYPSTTLWMSLSQQTYQTYMNAYTTDAMTSYPVASLSEKQLLSLADLYTDCCLHPLIMDREDIYRTEAWRYELEDMDSPLTLNGTVYSEMTGALTLQRSAMDNANEVTFPGAALSYDYGGKPEFIPDMTWDALREYHNRYYHPSNCIAWLYGSFEDYTAFLKLLNDAFSDFEKQEFSFTDSGYTRIAGPVTASVPYPVADGTDTENQSSVYYYIICPGLREDKSMQRAVDHACTLLNGNGSPLMINLKKAFPSATFSCGREVAAPDDAIIFTADNVNAGDAESFRTIVNDSLKQTAQNGFDTILVDAVLAAQQQVNKLALEGGNPVESVIYSFAYDYAVTGDPFEYVNQMEQVENIRNENDTGLLSAVVGTWMADPALWTLTTTYPEPGLKELQDTALADRLAEIKDGMSDEEKQAVIDETRSEQSSGNSNGNEGQDDATASMIAELKTVTVAEIPEDFRQYTVSDESGADGVRRLNAVAGVDGVGIAALYLDARILPQEDIHYLRLYTRITGKLDTDAHTKDELASLMDRYLMNRTIGVDSFDTVEKDDVRVMLVAEWTSMDEDLAAGYDLVKEVLFRTQFTDLQALSDQIAAQKSYVRNYISSAPYVALYSRQEGVGDPQRRFYDYMNYTAYYAFLENLEKQMLTDPEAVAARLQGVQAALANKAGAVAAYAGSEASIAKNAPLVDAFFSDMEADELEYPAYDLPVPAMREAVAVDGNIQYNCIAASFSQLEAKADYAFTVISNIIQERFLMPVLRDQMGAYGVFCGMDDDTSLYLISYRDPNVSATFDLYDTIPEKLTNLDMTQDKLDGYILDACSSLVKPAGELSGALDELNRIVHNRPADEKLNMLRAYKSVTPEKVRDSADVYKLLLEKGPRGTAGAIGALQENSGLYDVIMNPFHTEDLSQMTFTDVAEGSEHYDAIRYVFENGMMLPKEDGIFAPDDHSTVGDYLGALNVLFSLGSCDPVEARETFAAYGLVDADQDIYAELHEDLLCSIINNATGQTILTVENADAAISRAELADLLWQLSQPE